MKNDKWKNAPGLWPERVQLGIEARSYFAVGETTYFYGRGHFPFSICHFSFVIVRRWKMRNDKWKNGKFSALRACGFD